MNKRTLNWITFFEAAVFFLSLTGMVFVPASVVPRPVWSLLLGLAYLGVALFLTIRKGRLPRGRVGELMGGAFFTALGILLLVYPGRLNLVFGISLAVTACVGALWAAWNARRETWVSDGDLGE